MYRLVPNRLLALCTLGLLFLQCFLPSPVMAQSEPGGVNAVVAEDPKVVTRRLPESLIKEDFYVAKVKSVSEARLNEEILHGSGMLSRTEKVQAEILEGPFKGKIVELKNELTDNPSFNITVAPGKEVILSLVSENGSNPEWNIADHHRAPVLLGLLLVFLAAFLYFGGKPALKSLFGLATAIALVGFVLLPLSLKGFNPLLSAAFICLLSALVTIICIGGFSRKSQAALLGTVGGVIISGVAAQLVIVNAPLTGLSSEEAQILRASMTGQPAEFFSGLLAASMLIGALGVIMDVAISIASAVSELIQTDAGLSRSELFAKGMNVGRDIMGSMTCTLVLAYSGTALPLLLLMSTMPSLKLVNLDLVASEIAAALSGSLGLVCTIPLTAFVSASLMSSGGLGPGARRDDPFESLSEPKVDEGTRNRSSSAGSESVLQNKSSPGSSSR